MRDREIISRKDAKARGLKRLFTGRPCANGHICERFTSSYECVECSYGRASKWRAEHPDYVDAYNAKYRADNPEKFKLLRDRWHRENYEKMRLYRLERSADIVEYNRRWIEKNREKTRLWARKRRVAKRGSPGSHTIEELRKLLREQKFKCAYCGVSIRKKYIVDHIVPLSKGGTDDISNINLACNPCNARKYNKDPEIWAKEIGRLL